MNLTLQADVSPTTTRYSRMVTDVVVIHILMLVPPIFSPFFSNTLLILMKKKGKLKIQQIIVILNFNFNFLVLRYGKGCSCMFLRIVVNMILIFNNISEMKD
jgi:hypothetical protein